MDELMDLMGADASASQISDKIKDLLYAKSATKVDDYRSNVANSLFGEEEPEEESQTSAETDVETEVDTEEEEEDS